MQSFLWIGLEGFVTVVLLIFRALRGLWATRLIVPLVTFRFPVPLLLGKEIVIVSIFSDESCRQREAGTRVLEELPIFSVLFKFACLEVTFYGLSVLVLREDERGEGLLCSASDSLLKAERCPRESDIVLSELGLFGNSNRSCKEREGGVWDDKTSPFLEVLSPKGVLPEGKLRGLSEGLTIFPLESSLLLSYHSFW